MAHQVKATTNAAIRNKAMIIIGIFTALALFSIIMSIYDISTDRVVFGILFAVAALVLVIASAVVYELKRRGNFYGAEKARKTISDFTNNENESAA